MTDTRIKYKSYLDGRTDIVTDDWTQAQGEADSSPWMCTSTFLTSTSVGSGGTAVEPVPIGPKADMGDMVSSRPWDGNIPFLCRSTQVRGRLFDVMMGYGARETWPEGFILSMRMAKGALSHVL